MRIPRRSSDAPRAIAASIAIGVVLLLTSPIARAGEPAHVAARAGLDLATAAARSWAADARLVYLENDEGLDEHGGATRWGYLFHSASTGKARGYSVRGEKIVVAENLDLKLEAPPIPEEWIDSDAALQSAETEAGRKFRERSQGRLHTMLLMRGPFDDRAPDQTSWMLVYQAPGQPSLFVVVNAADGKVRRTWRG